MEINLTGATLFLTPAWFDAGNSNLDDQGELFNEMGVSSGVYEWGWNSYWWGWDSYWWDRSGDAYLRSDISENYYD